MVIQRCTKSSAGGRVLLGLLALGTLGCSDDLRRWGRALELGEKGGVFDASLGIQGHWYAYGDSYGCPATCTKIGGHKQELCARIDSPSAERPPDDCGTLAGASKQYSTRSHFVDFVPDSRKRMCTQGVVERLAKCCKKADTHCTAGAVECDEDASWDYSNMWGAGIGLDFNATDATDTSGATRDGWDAEAKHVRGVSFDLDPITDASLVRVNFPMMLDHPKLNGKSAVLREGLVIKDGKSVVWADGTELSLSLDPEVGRTIEPSSNDELPGRSTSEEYPGGSPFWQRGDGESPVVAGHNEIYWSEVKPPSDSLHPDFSPTRVIGIQFQVSRSDENSSSDLSSQTFAFCVGNLRFIY